MTEQNPFQIALDQLAAWGLVVGDLDTSGKLTRVKTTDDSGAKKSGWYVAHEFTLSSGRVVITGRFGNWKQSIESQAFEFNAKFTDEERAQFKAQQEQQRRAAEKEKRYRNKSAAERAKKIWPGLPIDGSSPYLQTKQINHFNARFAKNHGLAIPVTRNGLLVGLQFIQSDGSKKFLTGTEKQGAYSFIEGDGKTDNSPVVLCEGWATGASIRMATGFDVVVAFDAGNLVTVAGDMVKRLADSGADKTIIIAADNDHQKPPNKGLQVAQEIQLTHGDKLRVVWPEFAPGDDGTDFNDLHVKQGLKAVKAAIMRATPQAFPADMVTVAAPEAAPGDDSPDNHWAQSLTRNDGGKILPLSSNIELILQHSAEWRGVLAYCDFSYRIIKRRACIPDMRAGEWEDADSARLAVWLSKKWRFEPSRNKLTDALIVNAQAHRFHPVRDYLHGLTWDGRERIDNWLEDVYEASASDVRYLRVVGAKFLIGAVARVMQPGCKMDNVMILEGRQGLQKSTSIGRLFGEWYSDAPIPIGEKDAYQNIQGVWCNELAELDSFNKAESTSAKLFFSQVRDRYRTSYGTHAQDYPRQTIFVGTTNQGEYLKDYTGNRRYWPVKCNAVNIKLIEDNRDQYWAEAMHRYMQGDTWWADEDCRQIFEDEQDERMQIDPWEYPIQDYLGTTTAEYVTADVILTGAIEKKIEQITRADQNRISPIMKKLGWVNTRKRIPYKGATVQRHVYIRSHEGQKP